MKGIASLFISGALVVGYFFLPASQGEKDFDAGYEAFESEDFEAARVHYTAAIDSGDLS